MVKIIGKAKILLLLLALFFKNSGIELNLKITDFEGVEVKKVAVGMPFILNVTVESSNSNISNPEIKNLNKFNYKKIGTTNSVIFNGTMNIKKIFKYEININTLGKYTIGPAEIIFDNQKYISNTIDFEVSNEVETKIENQKEKLAFLNISVDKKMVVIGQKIILNIQFLYKKDEVKFLNLEELQLKDFSFTKKNKIKTGIKERDGQTFSYYEWNYEIFPKEIGNLVIPSLKGLYEIVDQNDFMNGFFQFFGNQIIQKTTNSNSLQIIVHPLPENKKNIPVGVFKNFRALINQNIAKQGEGILLKLEIEGDGDFENLQIIELNLPSDLVYYDSKSYVLNQNDNLKKKIFEFIIQPKSSGKFEISPQIFNFYDPEQKEYKSSITEPISLLINENLHSDSKLITTEKINKVKVENNIENIYAFHLIRSNDTLNLKWFLILLILPIILQLLLFGKNKFFNNYFNNLKIFKELEKNIQSSKKNNKYNDLQLIFNNFFCKKFNLTNSQIDLQTINYKLIEAGLDKKIVEKWHNFFTKLNELSFSKNNDLEANDIFDEVYFWLKLFKKKL